MSEMTTYEKLSAYGLLREWYDLVGQRRKGKIPARDTFWRAYEESTDTPLRQLIRQTGEFLLMKHEKEVANVESVPMAAQT